MPKLNHEARNRSKLEPIEQARTPSARQDPATEKQINFLDTLAKRLGFHGWEAYLRARCKLYGLHFSTNRRDISQAIAQAQQQLNR